MNTVLITRPLEDAEPISSKLSFRGFDVIAEPMLTIRLLKDTQKSMKKLLDKKPQAVVITSANGVRSLARITDIRDIHIIAVGDTSADEARRRGFWQVTSAEKEKGGNVENLVNFIKEDYKKEGGMIIHAGGSSVAGDLTGLLTEAGFDAQRVVLYDAAQADSLSDKLQKSLSKETLEIALFYSARTAEAFIKLIKKHGLEDKLSSVSAYCFSKTVADTVDQLKWGNVYTAKVPTSESLLSLIDDMDSVTTDA